MTTIGEMQAIVHDLAVSKGWWDGTPHGDIGVIPERLCLIRSEVSEALECYRTCDISTRLDASGKPEGLPSELADVVIRVMDLCGNLGIDLQAEIERKHAYNRTRAYRHGGKRC